MTSHDLATLSTAVWLVGTVALFILLAHWSSGGTWGLTSAIVQGICGWSDSDGRGRQAMSPSSESLRPMLDPYAFLRRDPDPRSGDPAGRPMSHIEEPGVEIIDLWERPIPRR